MNRRLEFASRAIRFFFFPHDNRKTGVIHPLLVMCMTAPPKVRLFGASTTLAAAWEYSLGLRDSVPRSEQSLCSGVDVPRTRG